ncbi:MAG: hypothetical protein WA376_01080, partial [Terrimicrobiaceae bacterium]
KEKITCECRCFLPVHCEIAARDRKPSNYFTTITERESVFTIASRVSLRVHPCPASHALSAQTYSTSDYVFFGYHAKSESFASERRFEEQSGATFCD